jgi:tetratricopeptide (TPR) repeat protein
MQNQMLLKQEAINAAKNADWSKAISINQEILQNYGNDLEAMNRLGLALLKNKQTAEAKKIFSQVVNLDSSNIIANKHLEKIKKNETSTDIIFDQNNDFIEEPGKSKIVTLHRLTGKDQLQKLKVGQSCLLQLKNRYISVTDEHNKHIGALPEDISFRLSKLISNGNEYRCVIYKINDKQCLIQIKETYRSKKNENVISFPSKVQNNLVLPDDFILEEDIPFEVTGEEEDEEEIELAMEKINKNATA